MFWFSLGSFFHAILDEGAPDEAGYAFIVISSFFAAFSIIYKIYQRKVNQILRDINEFLRPN